MELLLEKYHSGYKVQEILKQPFLPKHFAKLASIGEMYRTRPLVELSFQTFRLYDTTGNRTHYEDVYFDRRGRLTTFALLAWLYGRQEDLEALEEVIWAVCNEYTWMLPAHMDGKSLCEDADPYGIDLFSAETAQTLAEILSLLKERLSPAIVYRGKQEIFRHVLTRFLEQETPFSWERMCNNWCAVCAGSVGMAAIYLIEDEEKFSKIMNRLYPTLQRFLDSFEEDGACLEGLSYWTYGVSYFVAFCDLLAQRKGDKLDFLQNEKFRKIAEFQSKCYFVDGHTVSFADSSSRDKFRVGIACYLNKHCGSLPPDPARAADYWDDDPCHRWCQAFRDFLWADDILMQPQNPPQSCMLPDAQWAIFQGAEQSGMAIKGGHNNEPHNHNDIGSFLFYKNGEELISDLGCGEYTKDYFSEKRYEIFCNNSFGHSVPIINGEAQKAGRSFRAEAFQQIDENDIDIMFTDAYQVPGLRSLKRSFRFHPTNGTVRICDTFNFETVPESVTERLITRCIPMIESMKVKLCNTDGKVVGETLYNPLEAVPYIVTYTHSEHNGTKSTVYTINFTLLHPGTDVSCSLIIQ